MTTNKPLHRTAVIVVAALAGALALLSFTPGARAGRGSSDDAIAQAIASNNADVIGFELERSEMLPCSKCVGMVMGLVDHPEYRVREVAGWWIARRPFLQAAVMSQSILRLQPGADAVSARNAADVLGAFHSPIPVAELTAALDRSFPDETKAAVVHALGAISDPSGTAGVLKGLASDGPMTRAAAVQAYLDLRGARDGMPVVPLLDDPDAVVRARAVAVVGTFSAAASDARTKLETLVGSDADSMVRRNAAWALGRVGNLASANALRAAAAADPVSYVRSVAQAALKQLH
jgi:HEAT repeat protein